MVDGEILEVVRTRMIGLVSNLRILLVLAITAIAVGMTLFFVCF